MPAATIGTVTKRGTPKISSAAAAPANSATTFDPLAMSRTTMAKSVQRMPNSSRIRSPRPWPVTAPMRAAISRTTTSITVVIGRIHNIRRPVSAPSTLYVAMPPASFPARPAIKPGPITPRKRRIPDRWTRKFGSRSRSDRWARLIGRGIASRVISPRPARRSQAGASANPRQGHAPSRRRR